MMEQMDIVKRALTFKRTAKRLFDTPDGQKVLAYLKDSYVDNSAMEADVNKTMYRLGQKELVQSIVRLINEPEKLDEIIIQQNYGDE